MSSILAANKSHRVFNNTKMTAILRSQRAMLKGQYWVFKSAKAGTIKDQINKTLQCRPRLRLIHFVVIEVVVVVVVAVYYPLHHRL